MPSYHFEGMDASGSPVKDRIEAANQADAQRQLRERGYFVTLLREAKGGRDGSLAHVQQREVAPQGDSQPPAVDSSRSGTSSVNHPAAPSDHAAQLREFGWLIEPTDSGGIRMASEMRWISIIGLTVMLLPLSLFSWFMGRNFGRFTDGSADWFFQAWATLLQLAMLCAIGLPIAAIALQILWMLFVREEWDVSQNLLAIHKRILGFTWDQQYHDAELILDPSYQRIWGRLRGATWRSRSDAEWSKIDQHFLKGMAKPFWRVAVRCDGHKHYLVRRGPGGLGTVIGGQNREELDALVALLAEHTGWGTTTFNAEAINEAHATAPLLEIPTELQRRGFRSDVDEQFRLIVRRSRLGQLLVGIIFVVIGGVGLFFLSRMVASYIQAPSAKHDELMDSVLFWMLTTPAFLVCAWLALCGIIVIFASESWILGRNRLIVRSQLFGWIGEQHYVDVYLIVQRIVTHVTNIQIKTSWNLQIQDQAGKVLKTLRSDSDDNVPRLLGALLSEHTGWPVRDGSSA